MPDDVLARYPTLEQGMRCHCVVVPVRSVECCALKFFTRGFQKQVIVASSVRKQAANCPRAIAQARCSVVQGWNGLGIALIWVAPCQ